MQLELWLRPWALLAGARHRIDLAARARSADALHDVADHDGPLFVLHDASRDLLLDGREGGVAGHGRVDGADRASRTIALLPYLRDPARGWQLRCGDLAVRLRWPEAPGQPSGDEETGEDTPGRALHRRVETVWARLRDVENALADPVQVWGTVARLWTSADRDTEDPHMEPIARHARALPGTLDRLETGARRILRRRHAVLPVARVQELDRRAMLWLARQPGEDLAERAGPSQRIQAVARYESFDTLENRVLHSYARLACREALDYCTRFRRAAGASRYRAVQAYAKRCQRLHRRLTEEDRRVGQARPDVTPNFVLQNDPHYNVIWTAWQELLRRERTLDELWRWQARAFEEFCAVAVMVALHTLPGSRLVAASPLQFRDEQDRGRWLDHDNPLGVFHLAGPNLVVEVQHRPAQPSKFQIDFGAPLWLRVGNLDDALTPQQRVAIWPLAGPRGGLCRGEAQDLAEPVRLAGRRDRIRAGIVLRAARPGAEAIETELGRSGDVRVLATTLGEAGPALSGGIDAIAAFLAAQIS